MQQAAGRFGTVQCAFDQVGLHSGTDRDRAVGERRDRLGRQYAPTVCRDPADPDGANQPARHRADIAQMDGLTGVSQADSTSTRRCLDLLGAAGRGWLRRGHLRCCGVWSGGRADERQHATRWSRPGTRSGGWRRGMFLHGSGRPEPHGGADQHDGHRERDSGGTAGCSGRPATAAVPGRQAHVDQGHPATSRPEQTHPSAVVSDRSSLAPFGRLRRGCWTVHPAAQLTQRAGRLALDRPSLHPILAAVSATGRSS